MSGKAYTMREMKSIVDYLVDHNAYGEIKGRKMWMDFANSQLTTRTWQSLKETFLKRILPDIHNPYYKLSLNQICSFRDGHDLAAQDKNKLEIRTISEVSSENVTVKENKEKPNDVHNHEGKHTSGEDIMCSKITQNNRASVETLVLDRCYESTEDLIRDLESPNNKQSKHEDESRTKTTRDLITYSEPLTPMLQEVLDDFATDEECASSNAEPELEIVEEIVSSKVADHERNSDDHITIHDTESENVNKVTTGLTEVGNEAIKTQGEVSNPSRHSIENKSPLLKKCDIDSSKNGDKTISPPEEKTSKTTTRDSNDSNSQILGSEEITTVNRRNSSLHNSNSTNETLLPNNQEQLNNDPKSKQEESQSAEVQKPPIKIRITRKRSNSLTTTKNQKKVFQRKQYVSISDSDKQNSSNEKDYNNTKSETGHRKKTKEIYEVTSLDEIKDKNKDKDQNILLKNIPFHEVAPANNDKDKNISLASQDINPCLKSVSLYEEKLGTARCSDSDHNEGKIMEKCNNNSKTDNHLNDVVILKSHSESDSNHGVEHFITQRNNHISNTVAKTQKKDKALAKVFGFTSGGVTSRKRKMSHNKQTFHSYNRHNGSSGSEDWTSASGDDFVTPPRARPYRSNRKFLKPKSSRILSLEEEGGLFVMYGKKIYPLLKDGKILKHYLTYRPDSESDDEEIYWKSKYEYEKKKSEELLRQLEQARKKQSTTSNTALIASVEQNEIVPNQPRTSKENIAEPIVQKVNGAALEQMLKIKFTKNNEEVQLEGHWQQIHPVLEQVVNILHKDETHVAKEECQPQLAAPEVQTDSGKMTPIQISSLDEDVRKKIIDIEEKIFKEIEEKDRKEENDDKLNNVTVRPKRGRPKKSPVRHDSPKKMKSSNEDKNEIVTTTRSLRANVWGRRHSGTPRRTTAAPQKSNENENENSDVTSRKTKSRETGVVVAEDDSQVRYKFPSPSPKRSRSKSITVQTDNQKSKKN